MMRKRGLFWPALQALFGLLLLVTLAACSHSSNSTPAVVTPAGVPANTVRLHYHRNDGAYAGWGIWDWLATGITAGPVSNTGTWPTPNYVFTTLDTDGWGISVDIPMMPGSTQLTGLLVNGTTGAQSANMLATFGSLTTTGVELWVLDGDTTFYTSEPAIQRLALAAAQAVWLAPDTIVWPGATGSTFQLLYSATAALAPSTDGTAVTGADTTVTLTSATAISPALALQFPQYATAPALTIASSEIPKLLTGQLAVAAFDSGGKLVQGTSLQTAPVLDAVYAAAAASTPLGLTFAGGVPTFALWAPTAQNVTLNVYTGASLSLASFPMVLDPASGIWSFTAPDASWTNAAYYDFNVSVFSRPAGNKVVTNTVTDPYSVSLDANAQHSMVVNLADPATAPQGWPGTPIPTSATPTDAVIYELHIRDFSAYSTSANAGKYLAFTDPGPGLDHLTTLANAGLTHVHLLPAFDTSSVDELNAVNPTVPASTGAGTEAESFMISATGSAAAPQNTDWFNWGYDPRHYGAPNGSYTSDPTNGLARVMEFRQMVQKLHSIGLRVIMDVVYNHTSSSGQSANSVLDQIVPGYYQRLDNNGNVTNKSCCSDTATENAMMARLMTDTLVTWAGQYQVDGFRFDTMGLQPAAAMVNALAAVNAVAAADGRGNTYFYGEGWSESLPFVTASQLNMGNTGIGTFNDRLRDAVRGGGPFDSGTAVVTNQGFASGLGYEPTGTATIASQTPTALAHQNLIEVGLAGNLAAFPLNGGTTGAGVPYNGGPAGYTVQPQENLVYVACHDNETLWDISQYKQPVATTSANRARAQVVDLSTVLLANGVAFVQAGDDLLRSKSGDSNSYNSGDYFNRIFWDGSANNWAVGLPPQNTGNNLANVIEATAALTNSAAMPSSADIGNTTLAFQDFLAIRKSSSMFHLGDAASIINNVRFPDQGLTQVPGVIVMQTGDGTTPVGDGAFASALTVFNASSMPQTITYPFYAGRNMGLHPVQLAGSDSIVQGATFTAASGAFTVPARTTAVFVENAANGFTAQNPAIWIRGDMNSWGATPMKLVAPNTWQYSFVANAGSYGFKFAPSATDWSVTYGDSGNGTVSTSGGNINLATLAGLYVIQFNDQALTYTVLPPVWFPGVPLNVAANPVSTSATSLQITWSNSGGTVYNVFKSPDGIQPFVQIGTAADGAAGYTDSGLTTGTTYFYEVQAANALFSSALSATASGIPAAGGGFTATYTAMYMNGSWNGWATKTGAAKMALIADDVWSFTLTGLKAGNIQFKYDTDDDWGTTAGASCWTASDTSSTALTGTAKPSPTGDQTNITIALPADGSYTFTFNDVTLAYSCAPAA